MVGLERRFKCEEPRYLPAAGAGAIVLATQNPGPFPKEICVCMLVRGRVLSLVEAEGLDLPHTSHLSPGLEQGSWVHPGVLVHAYIWGFESDGYGVC